MAVSMESDEDTHPKSKVDLEAQNNIANKAERPVTLDPSSDLEDRSGKALDWESVDDPGNPRNWSRSKKIFHTSLPALFGFTM